MFENDINLIKYNEKVMIYKNFFSKEYVENITEIVSKNYLPDAAPEHPLEWYADKTTPAIPELTIAWNKISEFLSPTHVIHPQLALQIIAPGDNGMFVHADSPGEGNHEQLTAPDRWSTCCILDYGVIAYFGNYEGGEVFYPNLNKNGEVQETNDENCLEVPVNPGDLIIHGATSTWMHGVREVTKGHRLAFSNFCLKKDRNPGSFYNYGTKECEERQKDLNTFFTPLFANPQFPE